MFCHIPEVRKVECLRQPFFEFHEQRRFFKRRDDTLANLLFDIFQPAHILKYNPTLIGFQEPSDLGLIRLIIGKNPKFSPCYFALSRRNGSPCIWIFQGGVGLNRLSVAIFGRLCLIQGFQRKGLLQFEFCGVECTVIHEDLVFTDAIK